MMKEEFVLLDVDSCTPIDQSAEIATSPEGKTWVKIGDQIFSFPSHCTINPVLVCREQERSVQPVALIPSEEKNE